MNGIQSWDLSRLEGTKSGGNHASRRREIDIRWIYGVLVTLVDQNCVCVNARNFVLCVTSDQVTLKWVVKVGTCPDWNKSGGKQRTCCARWELCFVNVDDLKEKR